MRAHVSFGGVWIAAATSGVERMSPRTIFGSTPGEVLVTGSPIELVIDFDPRGAPDFRSVPSELRTHVAVVKLKGFRDAARVGAEALAAFPSLHRLDLRGSDVSSWRWLDGRLRELDVSGDLPGLGPHLRSLAELQRLTLWDGRVDHGLIESIASHQTLSRLFAYVRLDPPSVSQLVSAPYLRQVDFLKDHVRSLLAAERIVEPLHDVVILGGTELSPARQQALRRSTFARSVWLTPPYPETLFD